MTISSGEAPAWEDDEPLSAWTPEAAEPPQREPPEPSSGENADQKVAEEPDRSVPESTPPRPPGRTTAPAVFDAVDVRDTLGREVLAAHLGGLIGQIVEGQAANTAVVHVDGRWGAGKSTLVALLKRRLSGPAEEASAPLRDPIMIWYDAWRESNIAPEWWSVATAINRAVRRERALSSRCAMTVADLLQRTLRSPSVLLAGTFLALALASLTGGLWKDAEALGKVVTTFAVVGTLGLVAGRALFWSSPAFGRFQVQTDDNPVGHIATIVSAFRRWSPRRTGAQRAADTAIGVWILVTAGWSVIALAEPGHDYKQFDGVVRWLGSHPVPATVAVIAAFLVLGSFALWDHDQPRVANPDRRGPRQRHPAWSAFARNAWGRASFAVAFGMAVGAVFALPTPPPLRGWTRSAPEAWTAGAIALAIVIMCVWTRRNAGVDRRPLVLVVDDLDRCPADRVVKLLETIHTLLREPVSLRWFTTWRRPAALVVLVLADGRWVRAAFENVYEPFTGLGSDVHGLGADFVQKVFDHTVYVPSLSVDQVESYVSTVTRPKVGAGSDMDQQWGSSAALKRALDVVRGSNVGRLRDQSTERAVSNPALRPEERVQAEVARTAREATSDATIQREEHLLTRYSALMPANPRLVKRVANTVGMLFALKSHLNHGESEDVIVRAAVMYVRFPLLIEALLSDSDPPSTRQGELIADDPIDSPWLRRDVERVLGGVDPVHLARCFGRDFALAVETHAEGF